MNSLFFLNITNLIYWIFFFVSLFLMVQSVSRYLFSIKINNESERLAKIITLVTVFCLNSFLPYLFELAANTTFSSVVK